MMTYSKSFHRFIIAAIAAGTLSALPLGATVTETDWCTIDAPDSVEGGQPLEIKLTPKKEVPDNCSVCVHLHYAKSSGKWGGYLAALPSQKSKGVGETLVYSFNTKAELDCSRLHPIIFVAPKGDFNSQLKSFGARPPAIAFTKSAEQLAKEAARIRPESVDFKKSRLRIERLPGPNGRFYKRGDEVVIRVHYHLDPSENWGDGTGIKVTPLGPWIDNPDGVVNKGRTHVFIYGFWPQDKKKIEPGDGVVEFKWKVQTSKEPYCDVSFMAQFVGGDGKTFPTQARGGGFNIVPAADPLRIWAKAPGGLYKYGENIVVCCEFAGTPAQAVAVELIDDRGDPVYYGPSLRVRGGMVTIPPPERRGVFLCRVSYGGKPPATCFVATIPDVGKALGGRRAPFGCTNVYDDDGARAAALLGFKYCRLFQGWGGLEPAEGEWHLDGLDSTVTRLNTNGISPVILLTGAPLWAIPANVNPPGYEPFPFRDDAWRDAATTLAERFKGRIWGFEWLNEIVPGGKSSNPVEDYARFCKIGTEAVKAVDPSLQVQLAGGLWPRNFRLDLLRAGVGSSIDVLPVHYGSYDSVLQAREDFAIGGGTRVWDNETACGYSTWGMEPMAILSNSVVQCERIFRNWPGELVAGAEAIIYFGGEAAPAGNWTYLLDTHSPRPVAATIAVMASKLGRATPVGALYLEPGAIVYLFRYEDGGSLAFLMSAGNKGSCEVEFPVGSAASVTVTDYAGNERVATAAKGILTIKAKPMPVIVEGFDAAALMVASSATIAGQGPLTPLPAVRFTKAGSKRLAVTVRNPFDKKADGTLSATLEGADGSAKESFSLEPGESRLVEIDVGSMADAAFASGSGQASGKLKVSFPSAAAVRCFSANMVDTSAIGNLIRNGGMETAAGGGAAHWHGSLKRVDLDGAAPGYDGHAIEMRDNKGYASSSQGLDLPVPGIRYLYTAWVWTDGAYCGSNAGVKDSNGKGRDYMIPSCFAAPKKSKGWVLASKILDAVPGSIKAYVSPVGQIQGAGIGWAKYDNIRVSAYEGTEFAADARMATAAPKIDGDLAEWDFTDDPIPLCCENQLGGQKGGYDWSRANLSGVAAFKWDAEALYFAAKVKDDSHVTAADGNTPDGDSVTIAINPMFGIPGSEAQSQEWYISDRVPGGGSGKFTLFRPEGRAAGQKTGQLAKDSSSYDIAVKRNGDICCYELRIPWSEIKGARPDAGAKIGLSLRLSDADEGGRFARMNWGMGLDPTWSPSSFGVLTLVP